MKLKRIFFILSFFTLTGRVFGDVGWTTYTSASTAGGLAGDRVCTIAADSTGNVWFGFGAAGKGISRFDGENWKSYQFPAIDLYVKAIAADKSGNIWCALVDGRVCLFDGTDWNIYSPDQVLPGSRVLAVSVDSSADLWCGTDSGVCKFDGTRWKAWTAWDGLGSGQVNSIVTDRNGNVWAGMATGEIARLNQRGWTVWNKRYGLQGCPITALAVGPYNQVWAASDGGGLSVISNFDTYGWYNNTARQGLASDRIVCLGAGVGWSYIWFGFGENASGVARYDGLRILRYVEEDGLADNSVLAIVTDTRGYQWFGTDGGGVSRFKRIDWKMYTTKDGLRDNSVISLYTDAGGNIWASTWEGGVSKFDGESWVTYTTANGLVNNVIRCITQDRWGHMWFAAKGAVSRFDGSEWKSYATADGLRDEDIFEIAADSSGNIWIGMEYYGFGMFDGTRWRYLNKSDGLTDTLVTAIAVDKEGKVWAGGAPINLLPSGVKRLDTGGWTTFSMNNGTILGNHVYSITADRLGNIWFGIMGGISRYDGANWTSWTGRDVLGLHSVYDIIADDSANVWFSGSAYYSTRGLGRYSRGRWSFYKYSEGLPGVEGLWTNHITTDHRGNIWVGTRGGVGVSPYPAPDPEDRIDLIYFTETERRDYSEKGKEAFWTTYTSDNTSGGLAKNNITSVAADSSGGIWFVFGASGGGISRMSEGNWQKYSTRDGLPSDTVWSVAVDPDDRIWIGTDSGVGRFDGREWKIWRTADGLIDNHVYSLANDHKGNLWCGTEAGISRYDGTDWKSWTSADGLRNNKINVIFVDPRGNIWAGTAEGISRFDGSVWVTWTTADGLGSNNIKALGIDRSQNLWAGTYGGGISKFFEDRWITSRTKDGLPSDYIYSIYKDSKGNMWVGSGYIKGVTYYDGISWNTFTDTDKLEGFCVESIGEDLKGNLFFGTAGGGIRKYGDIDNWTFFSSENGLVCNQILCLMADSRGNLWAGFRGGGLSVFDGVRWRRITTTDGLPSERVLTISEDSHGTIWAGTEDGICKYDSSGWSLIDVPEQLSSLTWDMVNDSLGNIWFATSAGVEKFDGAAWTIYTTADGLAYNYVYTIGIDKDNHVWCGHTLNYISTYDGQGWTSSRLPNSSDEWVYITDFLADRIGDIWLATLEGLYRLHDSSWIIYTANNGLPSSCISAIAMDSSGFVWCGTNNGVARFDGNRWEVITEQNGLANNSISAIATDTRGFVWFGTYEGGISRTVADSRKIFIDNVVGVEDEGFSSKNQSNTILPRAFSLSQNFPNPFNPSTTICYTVPVGNIVLVSLEIFNLRGFLIRRLVDNQRAPGAYTVVWDGTDCSGRQVPSGVYFYRIKAGGFVQTRKMVLLK